MASYHPRRFSWSVCLVLVTLISGCGSGGPPAFSIAPGAASTTPVASSPLPSTPATAASTDAGGTPVWVSDLAGQLDCDGSVAGIGSEVPDAFGVGTPGDSPAAGLASFLGPGNPFASLPAAGYAEIHLSENWASYGHIVEGRSKVIIVLHDSTNEIGTGWFVVGLRACDASEFDPNVPLTFAVTIWTDASGARVSTDTIHSFAGPGHCGWDSAIWLSVDGNLYFRDPAGVMREWTATTFEPNSRLPAAALDSSYRTGTWALWLDPGGDAYVVSAGQVERWPRSVDPMIGCM